MNILKITSAACILAITGLMSGCGDDEETVNTTVTGTVQQGAIANALVFLDLNGNGKFDAGEPSATTNATGTYSFTVTAAQAELVTPGTRIVVALTPTTIDTITNTRPTGVLFSNPPSGIGSQSNAPVTNITPITTLVASVPSANRGALLTALSNLGMPDPNAPISTATPAIIALSQSVQTVIAALQASIAPVNADAASKVSRDVFANLATAIATATTATLTTPAGLATTLSVAASSTLSSEGSTVFTTAPTAAQVTQISTALNSAVTTVATAVQTETNLIHPGAGLATSPVAGATEITLITPVAATITTATSTATTTIANIEQLIVAPDTTPPTVVSNTTTFGIVSLSPTLSVQFSQNVQRALVNSTTITLAGAGAVPGTVNYDPTTFVATFTPANPLSPGTTYTLTVSNSIRNPAGIALDKTYTFTLTTVAPSGTTGGTSVGLGSNF